MSGHWIGIAAADHVRLAGEGGFAMFSHRAKVAVDKVKPGDWVAYHSPREGLKEGAEARAFTAIGQALDSSVGEREMAPGLRGWYRRMRWPSGAAAGIYPQLDSFSFVTDRAHWGMYFRRSPFRIPAAGFAVIAGAMGVDLR